MNPKRKHRILAVSAQSSSFQRRVRNSVSNNVIYTNKKASPSIPNAAIRVESDDVGAKDALSERTLKKYASATSAASTPNSQQKNDGSNRRIGGCPMSIRRSPSTVPSSRIVSGGRASRSRNDRMRTVCRSVDVKCPHCGQYPTSSDAARSVLRIGSPHHSQDNPSKPRLLYSTFRQRTIIKAFFRLPSIIPKSGG